MKTSNAVLAAGCLIFGVASQSFAATVTLSGTDVDFTFDDASLFGPGIVVGNSLFFQPANFKAESLNGAGAITASETLIIDVVATTPGYQFTAFGMVEDGDYIQSGSGASVAASGRLGVTSTTTTCGSIPFPCNDASIVNAGPFADTGGLTDGWSVNTSVELGDTAGWGSDTAAQISFQNNLSATTLNDGEQAMIQKKLGALGLVVVPIPAAFWLFGSGLLGLIGISRHKKVA